MSALYRQNRVRADIRFGQTFALQNKIWTKTDIDFYISGPCKDYLYPIYLWHFFQEENNREIGGNFAYR